MREKRINSNDFQTIKITRRVSWLKTEISKRNNKKIRDKTNRDGITNIKRRDTIETQIKQEKRSRNVKFDPTTKI